MSDEGIYSKQFAKRTNWLREENSVIRLLKRLKNEGQELLDLTESNPTRSGFTRCHQEILSSLDNPDSLLYSPESKGKLEVREAIAGYYRDFNEHITANEIFLTASTSEAYSYLFRLLTNAGDRILFPQPSYPLFSFLTDLNDITMDLYKLSYNGKWSIDFDDLERQITPETKAIVLVSPNNPTGTYISSDELHYINKLSARYGLSIICDEVFFDFSFRDRSGYESLIGNKENLTFIMNGCSKMLGLPQMKLSWIAMTGPNDLVEEAASRLDIIADTYLSVNAPVQNAFLKWFDLKDEIQDEIKQRIGHNREILENLLRDVMGIELLASEGGWYAVVFIPSLSNEEQFVLKLLEKEHVFVHPGYFYDFDQEGYLVISLLPEVEAFTEGIKRMVKQFLLMEV